MKKIAVLGSTGSIGKQTLDVARAFPDKLKIISLVAYSNKKLLAEQTKEFRPNFSALISETGEQCLLQAVRNCDAAVIATRGIIALECVIYCLKNGIEVALANKETLVCGGELVTQLGGKIVPVDSEHSAIWQCLQTNGGRQNLDKILLTASGGPFYRWKKSDLRLATAEQALHHPNWNMGAKITIDSATMTNKALEVVEAHFLFDVPVKDIEIVVHRQSVVHSMVRFKSGSVVAQMAVPNMRLPIQLALLGEERNIVGNLDFQNLCLTFEKCDFDKFPCAALGYKIFDYPPLCRAIMNAANDICVEQFLDGKLAYDKFYDKIIGAVEHFADEVSHEELTVQNIKKYDSLARIFASGNTTSDRA